MAYIRVSTDKQASDGNSLEAQRAKIDAYCTTYELELVAVHVDAGISAGTLERPALQKALAALDDGGAGGLLVVKLDRLTRSVRDLCDLVDTYFKDGRSSLLSVSEHIDTRTAAGRMVLNLLTVVGQWEREAAGERTVAVMQHMKSNGMFTGGFPPYGFGLNNEGELIPNPYEARIIEQARALRRDGMSLRTIAATLPNNPRTGRQFGVTQIVRML